MKDNNLLAEISQLRIAAFERCTSEDDMFAGMVTAYDNVLDLIEDRASEDVRNGRTSKGIY